MKRSQSFQNNRPCVYVISTPIGNMLEVSKRAIDAFNDSEVVFCEDTRVSGNLLNLLNIKKPLISSRENVEKQSSIKALDYLANGKNIAVVSDAGYPGISDPGSILINEAIKNDYNIVVVNGPSALIQSVIASGLPTNHFYFYGFLDPKKSARVKELESLKEFPNTIIFYQSPHKIKECLSDMLEVLGDRSVCLCRELTKKFEEYIRGNISEILPICEDLKGEMVLVVKGYEKEIKEVDLSSLSKKIDKLVNKGISKKEAIEQIAKENDVNKKELYQFYHNERNN